MQDGACSRHNAHHKGKAEQVGASNPGCSKKPEQAGSDTHAFTPELGQIEAVEADNDACARQNAHSNPKSSLPLLCTLRLLWVLHPHRTQKLLHLHLIAHYMTQEQGHMSNDQ